MGTKHTRAGKYVSIYVASLTLLPLVACSVIKDIGERGEAREYLLRAEKLLAQGDYEGSLRENQRALSLVVNVSPGDEALFNLGLIHAYFGNHKKEYQKSLGFFKKLIKDFPQSPLAGQAKIWADVLEVNEKLGQENEKLNEVIQKTKQVDIEIEGKKREKKEK
jgi:tetratricopeptide (TPR) repeat protein